MAARPDPLPELRIRRASPDDAATIAEFAARAFLRTFEPDNDPANVAAYVATAFGERIQREELAEPSVTFLLVDVDGRLAAFAQLVDGAADPSVTGPAPVQLERFYVDQAHHGRGVAAQLMEACVDAARAAGGRTLWLGVWERNARAIRFYEKHGFADVGGTTFQLGTELQLDRIMARSIATGPAAG